MVDKKCIYLFFVYLFFSLIIVVFFYIFYNMFQEICISLFIIYLLEFLNILINFKNMNEDSDSFDSNKDNSNNIEKQNDIKQKDTNQKNSNIKFFSYGVVLSGLLTFFISGGINSFIFIILLNLIINTNFYIFKEENIHIRYIFIIFCYIILSLRANFFNLVYLIIFCVEYKIILYHEYLFINLMLNAFFFINFNYFNLILLIFCIISFFSHFYFTQENKNEISDKKNQIEINNNKKESENSENYEKYFILNFLILSTLFLQTKGYECLETLALFVCILFQTLAILIKREMLLMAILVSLPIVFFLFLEYFFVINKYYNQKGIWINILYYYFLIF